MTNPVRVTIKGSGEAGANAPTVDDLLGQIRDFVEVLESVEKAFAEDHTNKIVWRVTDAERENPISFELTPTATDPGVFVGIRAEAVERIAIEGMNALRRGIVRPPYFTDDALIRVRKIHARVQNGLAATSFYVRDTPDVELLVIDSQAAIDVEKVFEAARPIAIPFQSLGSVEGFVARAELDGFGRAILRFKTRLDGTEVKAIATGAAFKQIEAMRLAEVWQGIRIRVYGVIYYKNLKLIDRIEADQIEVMDRIRLPSMDDIIDPDFTGGLTTEQYLVELRGE